MFRRLGVTVDYVATDWGTTVQRLASREPTEKGGWSLFPNYVFGVSMLGPAYRRSLQGVLRGFPLFYNVRRA